MNYSADAICGYPDCGKPRFQHGESIHGVLHDWQPKADPVNHPPHYNQVDGIECIQVARHFNFNRGNAIKYIWRASAKGDEVEDLRKAIWYLQDEITRLEIEQP